MATSSAPLPSPASHSKAGQIRRWIIVGVVVLVCVIAAVAAVVLLRPSQDAKATNGEVPKQSVGSGPTGSGPAVSPGTPGASQVDNPPKPETKPQSQAYRAQRSAPKPDADPGQPDFVPGQLIVQFKRNATAQQVEEVQKMVGAVLKEKLSSKG